MTQEVIIKSKLTLPFQYIVSMIKDTMSINSHCIVCYRENILESDSSFYKFLLYISFPPKRSDNVSFFVFMGDKKGT